MLYFNNDIFDDLFNGFNYNTDLKADLLESDGAYLLTVDIPGVDKKNVGIEYSDDMLTINVKREQNKDKDAKYLTEEREFGEFSRSFNLENIDEDNIKAKFENGVLEVVLPKKKEANNKKLIAIE